jgi:ATP-binding protein involved in chromosome partitioning
MAFLTEDDSPVIWRGPMLHSAIQQFFRGVRWNAIDYLIVDMPPGTGDVALSLSQTVPVAGAVLVTTPQSVAVADTRRAVHMYRKLNIPTLGLIENMSHFVCPDCGREADIFGKGGGEALAAELAVPFLGRIPLHEPVRTGGDSGVPVVIGDAGSAPAVALRAVAERVAQQVSIASFSRRAIPLAEVR